ncbi:transporter [Rhizobium vallis]|uniref:Transporter n=1 Tax=Rhizobium vallis TaxID=634290 RepID=A0A3S0QWT7_9HYPH|nr:TolC family protein [Rhizobium vallis]RUM25849.1 transporter [Rhizobium vallis]
MKPLKITARLFAIAGGLAACQVTDLSSQVTAPVLPSSFPRPAILQHATEKRRASSPPLADQQLNTILNQAFASNLSIDQARNRLTAARALANSSAISFRPGANIGGSANAASEGRSQDDLSRRPVQLNLETSWEIPLFKRSENKTLSSDLEASMAEADVEGARLAVAAEITARYIHLRALQHSQQNAEQSAAILEKRVRIAKVEWLNGLAAAGAVGEATLRLEDARARSQTLDNSIRDVVQELATLQGTAFGDASLLVVQPQPIVGSNAVQSSPSDVLRLRPDVRRAELTALQAGTEVGMAQADLYPRLHLSGMIGIGSPVDGSMLGLAGGPSLEIPVFDYGRRRDVVTARQAQFAEALSAYRHSVLAAFQEVSSSIRAYQDAATRTARAKTQVAAAKLQDARTSLLETQGLAASRTKLDSRLAYLEAQNQLIECLEGQALALVAFYKAAGMQSAFGSNGTAAPSSAAVKL